MPYIAGTDEAGYGPNLGPLTITAALWHVADCGKCALARYDLYKKLAGEVCGDPSDERRIAIADVMKREHTLPGADLYTIRLTIRRPSSQRSVVLDFKYDHRRS